MNPISVTVTGRLGEDPHPFTTRSGTDGVELRLAIEIPARGAGDSITRWVKVVAFGTGRRGPRPAWRPAARRRRREPPRRHARGFDRADVHAERAGRRARGDPKTPPPGRMGPGEVDQICVQERDPAPADHSDHNREVERCPPDDAGEVLRLPGDDCSRPSGSCKRRWVGKYSIARPHQSSGLVVIRHRGLESVGRVG